MLNFSNLAGGMKLFYWGIQFTFAVVMPLLVCILGGRYLQERFLLGDWVIIVSIIIAMIFVIADVYALGKIILKDIDKTRKKR